MTFEELTRNILIEKLIVLTDRFSSPFEVLSIELEREISNMKFITDNIMRSGPELKIKVLLRQTWEMNIELVATEARGLQDS